MIDQAGLELAKLTDVERSAVKQILQGETAIGKPAAWQELWYDPYQQIIDQRDRLEGWKIDDGRKAEQDTQLSVDEARLEVTDFKPDSGAMPIVSGSLLRKLALGRFGNLPPEGIRLSGFRIEGTVDVSDLSLDVGLEIIGSHLTEGINLAGTTLRWLSIQRCFVGSCQLPDRGTYACYGYEFQTRGSVRLRWTIWRGEVHLLETSIGGQLICESGYFINPGGQSLSIERSKIDGHVVLRQDFRSEGVVNGLSAQIGGQLDCERGVFICPGGVSLWLESLKINGNVFLRNGFGSLGKVQLLGAEISGQLSCEGGTFFNSIGEALSGERSAIKNNVFLNKGFKASGSVQFWGAEIGGQLDCSGGSFYARSQALSLEQATIGLGAVLGTDFSCRGGLSLKGTRISGSLILEPALIEGEISFGYATIGTLKSGFLFSLSTPHEILSGVDLQGLQYERFEIVKDDNIRIDIPAIVRTLLACNDGHYSPQPYEQVAKTLRSMGLNSEANDVSIAKRRAGRLNKKPGPSRAIEWLFLDFLWFMAMHLYARWDGGWVCCSSLYGCFLGLGILTLYACSQRMTQSLVLIPSYTLLMCKSPS